MHAHQFEYAIDDEPEAQPATSTAYKPDTPFLLEPSYNQTGGVQDGLRQAVSSAVNSQESFIDSPFTTEYLLGDMETEPAEYTLQSEILDELFDEEFEESLVDLVNDVRGVYEIQMQGELRHSPRDAERQMEAYLAPLRREIEQSIDKMIDELGPIDSEAMSERQLDDFLEGFHYETSFDNEVFEDFFKKIWKKVKKAAKSVVKKGAKVLKKGLDVVKKISPVHIILGKLKKLVRPLLQRVLKFALNKIPARFRPMAKRLAKRFLKGPLGEIGDGETAAEDLELLDSIDESESGGRDPVAAIVPPTTLATDFDSMIVGFILEGEEFEYNPTFQEYMNDLDGEDEYAADNLDQAREQFIQRIAEAETVEEAENIIEQFIPAILAGLKIGIKIIGRQRVVNFLAKLVAKLIGRFVGKQNAVPLSRALVDAGLSLVSLESPEAGHQAAESLAIVVEETIDNFVLEATEDVLEDDEVMEMYVNDAFERAVARNLPPRLLRRSLRQIGTSDGTWQMMPTGRRRKRYKKFSRTFDVSISLPVARQINSFGGQPLERVLKDQLGIDVAKQPVRARMHLYEAIRGTSLSDISHLEQSVEGLGSRNRSAWTKIHPLTRRAASLLIPNDVGLSKPVGPQYLNKRTRTAVGQRFYYLEIQGARTLRAPAKAPAPIGSRRPARGGQARASEINVKIDFNRKEIAIHQFLSEAQATELGRAIRGGQSPLHTVRVLRKSLVRALRRVLKGPGRAHLNVVREIPAEEGMLRALGPVLATAGQHLSTALAGFVAKMLVKEVRSSGQKFGHDLIAAAEKPEDGVTITFKLTQIPDVFDAMSSNAAKRIRAIAKIGSGGVSGALSYEIKPGFHK